MAQPARTTRTQGERSAAMQRRLLDATVEALYDKGYGGTTTLEVQHRAGVSRGALLHHYASRADLMVAAVDHLTRERISEVLTRAQAAPPRAKRVEWAVGILWSTFEGPLFIASLELWLAARNDEELLAALLPQERILGQAIRGMAADLFGPEISATDSFGEALELLLDSMRGAAARGVLRTDATDARLLAAWSRLMRHHHS
jgi:AcrR family transcriptional regulator